MEEGPKVTVTVQEESKKQGKKRDEREPQAKKCAYCNRAGHIRSECRNLARDQAKKTQPKEQQVRKEVKQLKKVVSLISRLPHEDATDDRLHKDASRLLHTYFDWNSHPSRGYSGNAEPTGLAETVFTTSITVPSGFCNMVFAPGCSIGQLTGPFFAYSTSAVFQDPLVAAGAVLGTLNSPYRLNANIDAAGYRIMRTQIRMYNTTNKLNMSGTFKFAYVAEGLNTPSLVLGNYNASAFAFTDAGLSSQKNTRTYLASEHVALNWVPNSLESDLGNDVDTSLLVGYLSVNAASTLTVEIKQSVEFATTVAGGIVVDRKYPGLDPSSQYFVTRYLNTHGGVIVTDKETSANLLKGYDSWYGPHASAQAYHDNVLKSGLNDYRSPVLVGHDEIEGGDYDIPQMLQGEQDAAPSRRSEKLYDRIQEVDHLPGLTGPEKHALKMKIAKGMDF